MLRSLYAKILLGYLLLGGLFIALVANSLIQFQEVEEELARQRQVEQFHDAVRYARRQEKNYLLYLRNSDLAEGVQRLETALDGLVRIRAGGGGVRVGEEDVRAVRTYYELLGSLQRIGAGDAAPQALLDRVHDAGAVVIRLGTRLDEAAASGVATALATHHSDLRYTILAALALAVIAGVAMTRSVVRPLRQIERSLQRVAKGEAGRVEGRQEGREVESLARSINDTLHEIELRQESDARARRLMALGTMLSGVAHELNNPLSNISSSCQILQEEWEELPPEQARQLLAQIDHQLLRAERIVGGLLDFSSHRRLERRPERLRGLIDEARRHLGPRLPSGVEVEVDVPEGLDVEVDRLRFEQVLVNLLGNAAEAVSREGWIRIRASPERAGGKAASVVIEIEDDGPGIRPEHLARVFDPFFTTKEVGRGTGLGLSVAHEIVVQHGGTIGAGQGTRGGACFRIRLPAQKGEAA